MVGRSNDALFTLNTDTGIATRIGTVDDFGVDEGNPQGLASHNGILYMVGGNTDALHSVDITKGIATQVGTATNFGVSETFSHRFNIT